MPDDSAAGSPPRAVDVPRGRTLFRGLLFLLLALLIVALGYDYLWARKVHRAAFDRLNSRIGGLGPDSSVVDAEPITQEQVIDLVGRQPLETTEGETHVIERYVWPAGLPWRTYDLYVVYARGQPPLLHNISSGHPPNPSELPIAPLDWRTPLGFHPDEEGPQPTPARRPLERSGEGGAPETSRSAQDG